MNRSMFCKALVFNQNIGQWDISNVTNMESTVQQGRAFNQNIGSWDTSSITNMSACLVPLMYLIKISALGMFLMCTKMEEMFNGASVFNGDISNLDTTSVTDMRDMFSSASGLIKIFLIGIPKTLPEWLGCSNRTSL